MLYNLSPKDWQRFIADLDEPPKPNAKLKALLKRKPVWEKENTKCE